MKATGRTISADLLARRESRGIATCLLALALLAAPIACAKPNQTASTDMTDITNALADAPIWLTEGCRLHWKNEQARDSIVCGVGSAEPNRNRVAARETAIARARSAIARSIKVTIESLVRIEDTATGDGEINSIVHQLTSASLPGCQLESVWQSRTGEVHALVSLQVAKVQRSVRTTSALSLAAREDLARRAADAFAAMDPSFDARPDETIPSSGATE